MLTVLRRKMQTPEGYELTAYPSTALVQNGLSGFLLRNPFMNAEIFSALATTAADSFDIHGVALSKQGDVKASHVHARGLDYIYATDDDAFGAVVRLLHRSLETAKTMNRSPTIMLNLHESQVESVMSIWNTLAGSTPQPSTTLHQYYYSDLVMDALPATKFDAQIVRVNDGNLREFAQFKHHQRAESMDQLWPMIEDEERDANRRFLQYLAPGEGEVHKVAFVLSPISQSGALLRTCGIAFDVPDDCQTPYAELISKNMPTLSAMFGAMTKTLAQNGRWVMCQELSEKPSPNAQIARATGYQPMGERKYLPLKLE